MIRVGGWAVSDSRVILSACLCVCVPQTIQNEPEFAAPWEANVYSAENERDFLKNFLGPVIRANHPARRHTLRCCCCLCCIILSYHSDLRSQHDIWL